MKLPFIVIVDDDAQVLRAILRDVKSKYREDYRIAATDSANEALDLIKDLKLKNETVALFISDQRMPEMEGIEFLTQAKQIFPEAKLVLLTAYSDIDAAINAINTVRLNYYLLKPWSPPEEKLYPAIDELLDDWQAQYVPDHEGIRVVGHQWSPKSHRLKEFLSGNLVPYLWMDVEANADAKQYLTSANIDASALPLVVLKDGTALVDPTVENLASKVGLKQKAANKMYDVVIVGAGPSGLAASVYGASEGLKTLLIERRNPGGQASSSARIENYLGFPSGLSGAELTRRAITQALRFGTEILTPQEVKSIRVQDGYKIIELADGSEISSKCIVISTGVNYRQLEIEGLQKFNGAGVYYGAAGVEAHACKNEIVYIVGGGNSTCQAALYMSTFAKEVHVLIRQDSLQQAAADYLVQNISKVPNIVIHPNTEVTAAMGDDVLERITVRNMKTGGEQTVPTKALFVYIGAKPGTDWLNDTVLRDEKGFVVTGRELVNDQSYRKRWKLSREPFMSEASVPGIFASGDVRMGALTGISSAVGEGALAIRFVRKYIQEM